MNTVTAQDFRDLKEARIKGSLNARINELEQRVHELDQMIQSMCDLLEAHKLVDFSILKSIEVDEDTPDEYNRLNPENYGGSK